MSLLFCTGRQSVGKWGDSSWSLEIRNWTECNTVNTLSIGDLKVHLHGELFIEQSHFNSNKAEPPNITTSDGDSFLSNHKCYKNWALICKIQNLECNFIKHRKQLKMNQSPQGNTFSFENNREKYSDVFQDIFFR